MKQYERLKRIFESIVPVFGAIRLVYLFGSRLGEKPGPLSDYDFAVLFDRGAPTPALCPRLASILAAKLETHRIDVVCLNDAPVDLAFAVISGNGLIYEHDMETRVEYEANIMSRYFDYLPVLRAFRRDILDGGDDGARVQRYRETLGRTQRSLGKIGNAQG